MPLAKVAVIGAGIAGLTASVDLAKAGFEVHVYEKNASIGGRGRVFQENGFTFDMGPSWYWMPDVFESFFQKHNKRVKDFFHLIRLNPSYRIIFEEDSIDAPSDLDEIFKIFEKKEPGSSVFLKEFLEKAKFKYEVGMKKIVRSPALSIFEYLKLEVLIGFLKLDLFKSIQKVIDQGFHNNKLKLWLTFPILFLGAKPSQTPALYSLMNYADMVLGTWYPKGGMIQLFSAIHKMAIEAGVHFHFNSEVDKIVIEQFSINGISIRQTVINFDVVLSTADYHYTDTKLLGTVYQQYTNAYWNRRSMSPSSLIFFLGIKGKIPELTHHNLFFDSDFTRHVEEIYEMQVWPTDPLFYVCAPSVTDNSVAPDDHENIFILIPVTAGIVDSVTERARIFQIVLQRFEKYFNVNLDERIIFKKEFGPDDFVHDYFSFKGNAYGMANTLRQTSILKPRMKHKQVKNLFFAGQLTHPGPGLPPSLISGELAAELIIKNYKPGLNES